MFEVIYNMLPDISGVLLAAVGVALVVAPEMVSKLPPKVRWIIATLLVFLGIAGLWSSFVQHREDEAEKTHLRNNLQEVKTKIDSYGPKLDAIINHPDSPEQKELALELQREMNPKIEISEPHNTTTSDPNMFEWTLINTGGSVARAKVNQVISLLAPKGRVEEDAIFRRFYQHENNSDQRPLDMAPGYEHRTLVHSHIQPPSEEDLKLFMAGQDVEYTAILVTYYNDQGRQFHSEKCAFLGYGTSQAAYCGSHNVIQ